MNCITTPSHSSTAVRSDHPVGVDPKLPKHADDSNSDDDAGPILPTWPWTNVNVDQPESVVGVSISRTQSRLASATTPAVEKEAAIQRGGGYFSLDGIISEAQVESPASEPEEIDLAHATAAAKHDAQKSDGDTLTLTTSPTSNSIKRSNSVSTTASSVKDRKLHQLHSQRSPTGLRRASSDGSLSLRRALSTASSLGDDARFENVKDQVNSRFKAIKDSFQDSAFRLPQIPSMPKLPNILAVVSKTTVKDDVSTRDVDSTRSPVVRESMLATLRKRAMSISKPSLSRDDLTSSSSQLNSTFEMTHPYFCRALRELKGDIIIMGGYRGSILRSSQPPNHRAWIPLKAGFNLTKVDLEVGLTDKDEESMPDTIYPDGMLTHIGPVDISRRLFKKLASCANVVNGDLRVHNYGYDWRLSPDRLSRQLVAFAAQLSSNQDTLPSAQRGTWIIAHSLGGLIARHAINQRPDLFRGIIYTGTPDSCVNILGPLRNGDDVLLNSKILTAQVNFTIRTSFALLPLDGKCFIDENTKEELPVDFFDVNDWIKYELSPCVVPTRATKNVKRGTIESISDMMSRSLGDVLDDIQSIGRRSSIKARKTGSGEAEHESNNTTANQLSGETGVAPQMSSNIREGRSTGDFQSKAATTSIPHAVAVDYLQRTLETVKKFKEELAPLTAHTKSNSYPPAAVIYGKTTPTVSAARVRGYESIPRSDAYDNLVFGSGDGVVLARAAMLPDGYKAAKGGVIGSDRGHISLLGDLEAVGRALLAIMRSRSRGTGLGAVQSAAKVDIKSSET